MNVYELRDEVRRFVVSLYPSDMGTLAWCASCELVGVETEVNIGGGAVVPWDVVGDSRPFVFVCDECAIGAAVVL